MNGPLLTSRRGWLTWCFFAVSIGLPNAALAQAQLKVSVAPGWTVTQIQLDGDFAGLPGDVLSLEDGEHSISFVERSGVVGHARLLAKAGGINMLKTSQEDSCGADSIYRRLSGFQATLTPTKELVGAGRVVPDGNCAENPSSVNCPEIAALVEVKSSPVTDAEIWVSGRKASAKTNSTLSVPFCLGMKLTRQITVRKSGYANCIGQVNLSEQSLKHSISCSMLPLK
jgi:hypothetical protein